MRRGFALEVRVYEQLGTAMGEFAPRYYGCADVGAWRFLALEDLGPKTAPPWSRTTARAVTRGLGEFHRATGEGRVPDWLEGPDVWFHRQAYGWEWLSDPRATAQHASVAGADVADAARWLREEGPRLASTAERLLRAPTQLLHGDVRADNLRWVHGRLYLFDWGCAISGPPELDFAGFAQSVLLQSDFDAAELAEWYEETRPLDRSLVDAAVCGIAGFFVDRAVREPIPELPRLRSFQRDQFMVSLRWALELLDVEPPPWLIRGRAEARAKGAARA